MKPTRQRMYRGSKRSDDKSPNLPFELPDSEPLKLPMAVSIRQQKELFSFITEPDLFEPSSCKQDKQWNKSIEIAMFRLNCVHDEDIINIDDYPVVGFLDNIKQLNNYISLRRNRILRFKLSAIMPPDGPIGEMFIGLRCSGIRYVGDLVQLTAEEVVGMTGVSDNTIDELTRILSDFDLSLGRAIPGWGAVRLYRGR